MEWKGSSWLYRLLLLGAFFCLSPNFGQAQDLDRADWERISKQYDYNKEKVKEEVEEEEPEDELYADSPEKSPSMSASTKNVLKYSLFAVVIGLLVFIVFRLVGGGLLGANQKISKDEAYLLEEIEDNLEEANIKTPLEDAVQAENYSLALRLYYLSILQALLHAGHIVWKKEKTNGAYIREIWSHPARPLLQKLTRIYEYFWFAKGAKLDRTEFSRIRSLFDDMLQKASAPKAKQQKTNA